MTNTDLIRELTKDVATLKERIENLRGEIEGISDLATDVALLQQRMEDLREGWKVWAQRIWMLLIPVVAAAIGAAVTYYLNSKK